MDDSPAGLDRVIAYLYALKSKGTFGRTELVWKGHDIVSIAHTDTYRPQDLPKPSVAT